jgi:hypothetical protein
VESGGGGGGRRDGAVGARCRGRSVSATVPDSVVALRSQTRLPCLATLALGVLSLARTAAAADVEPVRVEVHAPPGCADEARFFAEVRARTPRVRLASTPRETVTETLRVSLARSSGVVTGDLVLVDRAGVVTHRALRGETCEAVVSGLGWVAARAIDPEATFAPTAAVDAPPPEPAPPAPVPPLFPCAAIPVAPAPPPAPPPPPPPTPRWRVTAGAHAAILGVDAPDPVIDAAVFAEVARDATTLLAPSFRLSVHHTTDATASIPQTSASFAWTFARVEACPWRFDLAHPLALRACALVDAGVLSADGGGGAGFLAGSHLRPWVTAGELARLEWTVGLLRVEVEGGLALPLVRENFAFDAATSVYVAPVVVGFAGIGLGVRFP